MFDLLDKSKLYKKLDHIFINIAENEKFNTPNREKYAND
jgi:hypothetical protein